MTSDFISADGKFLMNRACPDMKDSRPLADGHPNYHKAKPTPEQIQRHQEAEIAAELRGRYAFAQGLPGLPSADKEPAIPPEYRTVPDTPIDPVDANVNTDTDPGATD
jgi:hypothetical protein